MAEYMTPEREEYIAKLDEQIQVIDRILKMDLGSVVSAELKKQLRKLKTEAETVQRKLKNNEFEIAIVGEESSGKSTFANALMGNSILPRADKRCTYTSTRIAYSGDDNEDSAVVSFYTVDEFDSDFKDKLRQLCFPNYEMYSFDTLDYSKYKAIYDSDVPDDVKDRKNTDSIRSDVETIINHADEIRQLLGRPEKPFNSEEISRGDLTAYITDEVKALAVSGVVIYSKQLVGMKNAVIYDVPGFNSPTALHKQQTLNRMKSADAIIITAKGDEPSITEGPLKILQASDDDGNPLQDKLFVFANKIERSTDVTENVGLIQSQWTNAGFVAPTMCGKRIYYGSALAHLQAKGLCLDPDGSSRALREFKEKEKFMPAGDGIDALREGLENYNKTERFEVLKRRINRIKADIFNAFSDIRSGNEDLKTSTSYSPEQVAMVAELIDDVRPAAEEALNNLKAEIRDYMQDKELPLSKLPLSKQIIEYITENITTENYSINDELLDKVEKELHISTGCYPDVAAIDIEIRKRKFKEMYEDFSQNVINIADKHHSMYSTQVIDIILNAMGMEEKSSFRNELLDALKKEIAVYRTDLSSTDHSNELYYQSLIERFSRYIYQILILKQYNAERLREFYASIDDFYSLSVFYKKPDCKDDLAYIDIAPKDQPLCMMLLFHHYLNAADNIRLLMDDISRISGIREVPEEITKIAEKAFSAADGNIGTIIDTISKKASSLAEKSDDFRINIVRQALSQIIESNEPCSVANEEAFTQYYERYHSSIRGGKLYSVEDFRADFDVDIQILQDVLVNAFVRAISMEKPFVAREAKSIDDIIDYIKSKRFGAFLSANFYKIKYEENQLLDKQRREQEQNAAIIQAINGILDSLAN